MSQIRKILLLLSFMISAISISSCSKGVISNTDVNSNQSGMQVGNIGAIPTNKNALGSSYPLMVYNNSKSELYIDKVEVSGLDPQIHAGTNDSNLIDKRGCSIVPSGGSCPIIIHSNALHGDNGGLNGQYALTIHGHDNKKSYTQSQLVAYENYDPIIETNASLSGVYYNPSNANNFNIRTTSNDGTVIPIYFDHAYNNVKILNGGLPVSLLNCGLPNENGEYNIAAHSSCALSINITGGKRLSNVIQVVANYTGNRQQLQHNQLKPGLLNSLTTNDVLVNLGVVNSVSSAANVVSGVVNGIVYANGSSPQTVTFINTGAGSSSSTAMSLVVNSTTYSFASLSSATVVDSYGTTAQVTNDTCTGANIAPYGICSVTFVMNGITGSGSAQVLMNYNTGVGTASTFFNNYYYSPGARASLVTTMNPTNMTNVALYYSSSATVTVQNPSSSTVSVTLNSNAQIFNPPANNVMTITQGSTPCTSGQVLAPGSSCTYQITYTPTVVGSGSSYTGISGTYPGLSGSIAISSTNSFNYSSINPTDLLFNPTAITMVSLVNNTTTMIESVTNNTAGTITNIVFNFSGIGQSYVTQSFPGGSNCLNSLAAGQTCSVQFSYHPTTVESINNAMMVVSYTGGAYPQDTIQSTFVSTTGGANIVASVSESQINGPVAFTGVGTFESPVNFYNYGNSTRVFITYTNNGNQAANNFVIDASTVPNANIGYTLNTSLTTCPTGSTTSYSLAVSASCVLVYDLSNPNYSPSFTSAVPMNFTIPTINYIDNGSLLNMTMNTWSFNGNGMVYINSQPILAPSTTFSPVGWIVANGSNTYYAWSTNFANNSSGSAVTTSFNISSPISGGTWSTTAGNVPGNGATISSTIGSGSTSNWYYNLPYSPTINSQSIYTNWSYAGLNGAMSSTINSTNSFNNPATGFMYVANSTSTLPSWIGNSGTVTIPGTLNGCASSASPVFAGFMSATGNRMYTIGTQSGVAFITGTPVNNLSGGVYSGSTPSGACIPGGNAGAVPNSTTTAGPSLMLQRTVGGNTQYYIVTQAGSESYFIGTMASLGMMTQTQAGTFTGTDGSAIYSIAADNTNGNVFITTTNNNLYYCGNIFNTSVGTCSNIALPTTITTAGANSTITGYAVLADGGQVMLNQVVSPTAITSQLPSTVVVYGADNAGSTTFSSSFTISNLVGAKPLTFNYNVGNLGATPSYSYGLHGSSLVYNSGNYVKTATVYGYSINNMNLLFNFATGAAFLNGYIPYPIAIISMIPIANNY